MVSYHLSKFLPRTLIERKKLEIPYSAQDGNRERMATDAGLPASPAGV
jgi:hypothetical protein